MSYKTYLNHATSVERKYNQDMAALLSKAVKAEVTERDFVAWAGDDTGSTLSGCMKVDKLVKTYMGPALYREAGIAARMLGVLEAKLRGKKSATISGCRFTNLQKIFK